jgi:hypothetical protein
MVKRLAYGVAVLYFLIGSPVYATSFGYMGEADLWSINGKPLICLRKDAEKSIPVGWIIFSESYVQGSAGWGVKLKSGATPFMLQPGACLELGFVPDGYELDGHKMRVPLLPLEANKTYVFSLADAYRPRDSYTAIFCVAKSTEGAIKYLQYIRLPDGGEIIPSCGAKRNRSAPSN